jgi:hypothetical protein
MNEFNLFNILYLNIARDARLSQRLFNMDGMFKNKQELKRTIVLKRNDMEGEKHEMFVILTSYIPDGSPIFFAHKCNTIRAQFCLIGAFL